MEQPTDIDLLLARCIKQLRDTNELLRGRNDARQAYLENCELLDSIDTVIFDKPVPAHVLEFQKREAEYWSRAFKKEPSPLALLAATIAQKVAARRAQTGTGS